MCISGGMKVSMLGGGATAAEVRAYTKRLCQEVGKGGGFIMSTDIGSLESCKPEMIEVWVDATREFGRY
jgi:uroporphyrinogen-III decarboxylase